MQGLKETPFTIKHRHPNGKRYLMSNCSNHNCKYTSDTLRLKLDISMAHQLSDCHSYSRSYLSIIIMIMIVLLVSVN